MSQIKLPLIFTDVIKQMDRKLLRKLILEEQLLTTYISDDHVQIMLQIATESRDVLFARRVLEFKPDLSTPYGAKVLWTVVEDGDTEIASMLVRAGADVNVPTNSSSQLSFLHVLAKSKSPKKFELALLMMEHGADVTAGDAAQSTVLEYAVRYDNFALASQLLQRGAAVDEYVIDEVVMGSNTVEWLLFFAESYVHDEAMKNEIIANMFSWLCGCQYDDEKISLCLKTLLNQKIPEISVIFDTVLSDNIYFVKTILDTDIDSTTKMLLLHPAVSLKTSDIASMLIDWGADIQYRMEMEIFGFTKGGYPIHIACAYGSLANIKLLLHLGADINVTDDEGNTPFLLMVKFHPEFDEIHKLVIKHLVMQSSKKVQITECDRKIIHSNLNFLKYHDDCRAELRKMKRLKIFDSIPYYSLLITDVKKLSFLTRRQNFVKKCEFRLLKESFSLYYKDMDQLFRRAVSRKNFLLETEDVVYESLGEILPELAIENILYFLYSSDV